MPPSHVCALKPRSGPLPEVVDAVGPPLSLKKKISVFSSRPSSRSFASTLPTASSIAESIAQNLWRFTSLVAGKRLRYFSIDSSGACTALKGR